MKTNILITGGCGFIGVNLIRSLVQGAARVRVLDDLSNGNKKDLDDFSVEIIEGDVRNKGVVQKAVKEIDVIVHLAAHTRVVEAIEDPGYNFDVNGKGTLHILSAAKEQQVQRVIFASTGGAIIGDCMPPVHEEMIPRPLSPYGASKLMGEGYCSAFSGSYGMSTIALRFANVYGPYSYHKGSVVAKYFKNIIREEPLVIYGDGTQTRDFVFIGDLCRAIQAAVDSDLQGHHVFNLGSGKATQLLQLIEHIGQVTGCRNYPVEHRPARQGEVIHNYTRIDKAKQILGYYPEVGLLEGLKATWDWFSAKKTSLLGV